MPDMLTLKRAREMQLQAKCELSLLSLNSKWVIRSWSFEHDFVEELIYQAERNHILFQTKPNSKPYLSSATASASLRYLYCAYTSKECRRITACTVTSKTF